MEIFEGGLDTDGSGVGSIEEGVFVINIDFCGG